MKLRIAAIAGVLLFLSVGVHAELLAPDSVRKVGERAPNFSLVSDAGTLVDYDRDYYGRHHLILTFFPAAFTPV